MIYNDKPGFLDKDDLIKALAHDVERLREELRECRYVKDAYHKDVLKVMDENIRLRNELTKLPRQRPMGFFAWWQDWLAAKEGKPSA